MTTIKAQPLTAKAFAPFGDVLDTSGPAKKINAGLCDRHHDLAKLDFSKGKAGVSLFNATPRSLPYTCDLMERHPLGSQCFVPMTEHPFLVIVAPDDNGKPGAPVAFLTTQGQAINLHRNIWHGVLTPLHAPGLFAVIDRIADDTNLQEYTLPTPFIVTDVNVFL